jgi:pimeloyl-ACP methyl ester carboxylesterase
MTLNKLKRDGGVDIAYTITGKGPAVLLVHGFLSSAEVNWGNSGVIAALASAGFQVIAPDLRGHGHSSAPEDTAFYPPDILAADMEAIAHAVAPQGCHLVGYSLGARTVMRMILRGAKPGKLVLGGMGLSGLTNSQARQDYFVQAIEARDTLARGDAGYEVARFIKSTKTNPQAAINVLRSQVDSPQLEFTRVTMPTLVIAGDTDADNGSAAALTDALPTARYRQIKGTHMTTIMNPEFAGEITQFLLEG